MESAKQLKLVALAVLAAALILPVTHASAQDDAWRTWAGTAGSAMILNAGSILATKVLERLDSALTVMVYINLITFFVSLPGVASPWPWEL